MIVRPASAKNGDLKCLVLDAMGVVFSAADDVAELLIPFVRNRGGTESADAIQSAYVEASLGAITPDAFWLRVGLRASLEDDYLAGHSVTAGALDLLKRAENRGVPVWLLSNDIERWSRRLRALNHRGAASASVVEEVAQQPSRNPRSRVRLRC